MKKHVKQTFQCALPVFIFILFVGCSKLDNTSDINSNIEERYKQSKSVSIPLNRKEANFIALKYLRLINNQYILNLSESQALNLGISKLHYDKMIVNVEEVNAIIRGLLTDPNCKLDLPNPQNITIGLNIPMLKTNMENDGDIVVGRGDLNGQYPAQFDITVPRGYNYVHVDIYSNALIGYGTAELSNSSGLVSSDYTVRFSFFGGGGCDLSVPQSGVRYTLLIRVASTEGGNYSYYYK